MKKRYLILETGEKFEGYGFGASRDSVGELVFTTGMCGYIETMTDPSYYGQIVMQTFPLIGNYGIIESDFEGDCALKGYVVREWCDAPSNFRCEYDIDKFLKDKDVPGIFGLDTREITKIIREKGVMNAVITDDPEKYLSDLTEVKDYAVTDAVKSVTTDKDEIYPSYPKDTGDTKNTDDTKDTARADSFEKYRVTLIDYGAKANIVRELTKRGCKVKVVPASTPAAEILKDSPDGVMLSNGPGDPAENTDCIKEIAYLMGKVSIFGICLGHQLLALANGGKTEKLKYGHRGVNQPVKETDGKRTYITSQNHGYAVVLNSTDSGKTSFVNANDGTCEGIDYAEQKAFSVQFHPEACSGPRDTSFLFDKFISLMGGEK